MSATRNFARLAEVSILCTIFSISLSDTKFMVSPFSVLLGISLLLSALAITRGELRVFLSEMKYMVYWSGAVVLTLIVAYFYGKSIHIGIPLFASITAAGAIVENIGMMLVVTLLLHNNPRFFRRILWTIGAGAVSSLLYTYAAITGVGVFFDISNSRFIGMFNDPNLYASFCISSLMILYGIVVREVAQKNFLYFMLLAFSIGTLLWSGSRGGWVGVLVSFAFVFVVLLSTTQIRITRLVGVLVSATLLSLILIPAQGRTSISNRLTRILDLKGETIVAAQTEERGFLWKEGLTAISQHPLGYGPAYAYSGIIKDPRGNLIPVHNTLLEAALTGGVGLLVLALLAIFVCVKSMRQYILMVDTVDPVLVTLCGAYLGTVVSSLFNDMLLLHWIWVLGTLILFIPFSLKTS